MVLLQLQRVAPAGRAPRTYSVVVEPGAAARSGTPRGALLNSRPPSMMEAASPDSSRGWASPALMHNVPCVGSASPASPSFTPPLTPRRSGGRKTQPLPQRPPGTLPRRGHGGDEASTPRCSSALATAACVGTRRGRVATPGRPRSCCSGCAPAGPTAAADAPCGGPPRTPRPVSMGVTAGPRRPGRDRSGKRSSAGAGHKEPGPACRGTAYQPLDHTSDGYFESSRGGLRQKVDESHRLKGELRTLGQSMVQSMTCSFPEEVWDACEIRHPGREQEGASTRREEADRARAAEQAAESARIEARNAQFRKERELLRHELQEERAWAWLARQSGWSVLDVEEVHDLFSSYAVKGTVRVGSPVFMNLLRDIFDSASLDEIRAAADYVLSVRRRGAQPIDGGHDPADRRKQDVRFSDFFLGLARWLNSHTERRTLRRCRLMRFAAHEYAQTPGAQSETHDAPPTGEDDSVQDGCDDDEDESGSETSSSSKGSSSEGASSKDDSGSDPTVSEIVGKPRMERR